MDEFREEGRREADGWYKCAGYPPACAHFVPHVDVDHNDAMFMTILAEFCEKHPNCTLTTEDPLLTDWQAYHKKHCSLQRLCKDCHHRKSGGETSQRARDRASA